MIIRNLHIVRMPVPPRKTHSVLIVDPYRVLPIAIPRQLMQPVPGRHFQIVKLARGMKHIQFPSRDVLDGSPLSNALIVDQPFGVCALKRLNHKNSI
jgi:hypothetical protein